MADFVRLPMPDGTERVILTRLTDGRVMCCVCFEYTTRDQLARDEGNELTDVCAQCAPKVWTGRNPS